MVGEGERKLLKEIVKQARNPVKSRVIAPEIINKFKGKLRGFEEDVQEILKQEREDKEVGQEPPPPPPSLSLVRLKRNSNQSTAVRTLYEINLPNPRFSYFLV